MAKGKYAARTSISVERSKAELEKTIKRWGADEYRAGWSARAKSELIDFSYENCSIRMHMTMTDDEQENRRRWRSMVLVVKAKLESVETGISTFQEEFMAHIVMANGKTLAENIMPRLLEAAQSGKRLMLNVGQP